jgi:VWFA-related protein
MSPVRILRPSLFAALLLLTAANAASLLAQPPGAAAQTRSSAAPEQAPAATASTLNVDARLVNIPVVVHDKKGALVQTLAKDNFVLQVDGKPQTIRTFNRDTDLPLTLGLLVDVSQSQRDAIDNERTASFAFLDDTITSRDKAFVVQFARQTDLLQDVTSSKPKLQAGLKQLETPASGGGDSSVTPVNSGSNSGSSASDSSTRPRRAGTTLYDALFLASEELMSKQAGRKAIVILSGGVDSGSKESLASSIEAAQRADTIVYAIYFKGRETTGGFNQNQGRQGGGAFPGGRGGGGGFPGGGGGYPGGGGRGGGQGRQPESLPSHIDGKKILQRIADETGGALFEVSKKETFAEIYKLIGDELRAQYRLGYTPDKESASDGYHRIVLSLSKSSPKDLFLQTRDGYYSGN